MIRRIEIKGFKSFEHVGLEPGPFNLLIGTNASGKSNFFDALRVLQGIGSGFSVSEILNGKPRTSTSEVWDGIRGGSKYAAFAGGGPRFSLGVELGRAPGIGYSIEIDAAAERVTGESLTSDGDALVMPGFASVERGGEGERVRPALSGARVARSADAASRADALTRFLTNGQHFHPDVELLRGYSESLATVRMGDRGENFAAVVGTIMSDAEAGPAYLAWLRELTPAEVDAVVILRGAVGEPLFAIKTQGQTYPAPVLSDGTLRFAGITAAFFQKDPPAWLTLEEIENGIHPSRLRLLVELLRSRAGASGIQVFATTHSPVVLAWLNESDYPTTFLCRRDEATGATTVTPLSELPEFVETVRRQPLSELFAEGWLESVL